MIFFTNIVKPMKNLQLDIDIGLNEENVKGIRDFLLLDLFFIFIFKYVHLRCHLSSIRLKTKFFCCYWYAGDETQTIPVDQSSVITTT